MDTAKFSLGGHVTCARQLLQNKQRIQFSAGYVTCARQLRKVNAAQLILDRKRNLCPSPSDIFCRFLVISGEIGGGVIGALFQHFV